MTENRVEIFWIKVKRRKWLFATAAIFLILGIELAIAWAYVAKRILADQPVVDLIERYYALRPFRSFFPDQYPFPEEWKIFYRGDQQTPGVHRYRFSSDPILGYRLIPGVLTQENVWTYRVTNSQGFIISDLSNPTYSKKPKADTFRIIVLGGSTVEGDGASGSLAALPAKIQFLLTSSYSPRNPKQTNFEVINAGVGGYFSGQELLYFLSDLHYYGSDLVISYGGWNDSVHNNRMLEKFGPMSSSLMNSVFEKQKLILDGHYLWPATSSVFLRRTATAIHEEIRRIATVDAGIIAGKKIFYFLWKSIVGEDAYYQSFVKDAFFSPASTDFYIRNIEMLAFAVHRSGSDFAWFLQPLVGLGNHPPAEFRERDYFKYRKPQIQRRKSFYRIVSNYQKSLVKKDEGPLGSNICAADLTDVFDGNPTGVYEDFGHLFDVGNEIVAERIAQELERCGLISKRLESSEVGVDF